ncbi:guanylate kinase [Sulfobacillus thermosulfidooxidans]|uniref:guanylate kinase n=1 Tax=Sulfobacillus thermosulfidooxidans TaxID=28034 RepID=UPI00031262DE|nr:guanylate kinase [Sulfobacillus thermosulfidooxidans]
MKGHIFILIGPSGAGKTTLANTLHQEGLVHRIVTWTTRSPRPGEVPGRDYIFVTPGQFDAAFHQGDLLEREYLYGTWYGTPIQALSDALHQNHIVLISMGLQGARTIKQRWPSQSTIVAVLPPNPETLYQRLLNRGISDHDLAVRWPVMQQEANEAQQLADCLIINDALPRAIAELKHIISQQTSKIL